MIRLREFNMAELEYFIDPINRSIMISRLGRRSVQSGRWRRKHASDDLRDAVEKTLVRHPTVGFFMGRTYDFLIGIGIDANRLRFRQHASDEMAHYATDCWDVEIEGSYGWVECVGIAHRGCYDLEATKRLQEKHSVLAENLMSQDLKSMAGPSMVEKRVQHSEVMLGRSSPR